MPSRIDLTGSKFGCWTVVEKGRTVKTQRAYTGTWLCQCTCGEKHMVGANNLRRGISTQCVKCAKNRKEVVSPGEVFSKWTVVREVDAHVYKNGRDRRVTYLCRCECGVHGKVMVNNLRTGRSTQCRACARLSLAYCLRPYEALYNRAKDNAIKGRRNWEFTLPYETFVEIAEKRECHYCWVPLTFSKYATGKNGSRYQLDRKDNALGYTQENVVAACKRCNYGKSDDFSYEEWYGMNAYQRNLRDPGRFRGMVNAA